MNCSLTGSSVHGVSQASILECVAISFSTASSWPRDRIPVSCIAGRFFTSWATREAPPDAPGSEWLVSHRFKLGNWMPRHHLHLGGLAKAPLSPKGVNWECLFSLGLFATWLPLCTQVAIRKCRGSESLRHAVSSSVWSEYKQFSTFRKWISKCCSRLEMAFFFKMKLFIHLTTVRGMWDLNSPTRSWTQAPCTGSSES